MQPADGGGNSSEFKGIFLLYGRKKYRLEWEERDVEVILHPPLLRDPEQFDQSYSSSLFVPPHTWSGSWPAVPQGPPMGSMALIH